MKELVLMRHAKAVPHTVAQGDHGRPLNGRGHRAASIVALELRRRGLRPDLILCSPARRTRETLDHVLDAYPSPPPTRLEPELYLAEAERLIDRFRQLEADVGSALLIGHNEGLAEAAILLATTGEPTALASMRAKFPTGAVAWLRLPVDDWADIGGRSRGELVAFIRPRDLGTEA
ncbi:histidine phosphatase family protein [Vineibacter terrae]|uniref:SixA phosphatase family protein n=1 Tax=Vineibacter terrae TaxID=2586908 RepID=UPI002E2FD007|nr:histidine phosphatase family protein [Vineibacter terrae]HEX2892079.1 histidine phosphatase family protein [Vineibacter terrae]